jgi:hypothetical protein
MFELKESRGTYRTGQGQYAVLFHLEFIPTDENARLYQIKVNVKKEPDMNPGIELNKRIDKDHWPKFDQYIKEVNTGEMAYSRDDFRNAVNTLITKGLFILLGIENFPLSVDIKPLSARSIDTVLSQHTRFLYKQIVVANNPKTIANIVLKQGDQLSLTAFVNRMEIDSIERTITLSGKNLNENFSSPDSEKTFFYTATTNDDAIIATYELTRGDIVTTDTIGKLNVFVYEEKPPFKLKLIPVNNASVNNGDVQKINEFINAVYNPILISWEVAVEQSRFTVSGFRGSLTAPKTGENSYSSAMNNIIDTYKNRGVDNETYYIFVVDQMDDGFMPLKNNFGFVAYNSKTDELGRAIAHELGHGAFGLKHIFDDYPSIRRGGTNNNLMDHINSIPQGGSQLDISKLYKYQWDLIHNFERGEQTPKNE